VQSPPRVLRQEEAEAETYEAVEGHGNGEKPLERPLAVTPFGRPLGARPLDGRPAMSALQRPNGRPLQGRLGMRALGGCVGMRALDRLSGRREL